MPKVREALPVSLARGVRRFEKWRETRLQRRIPDQLWELASTLGREYGVNRTARALRLDYYDLKQRVEAVGQLESGAPPSSTFVEVWPSDAAAVRECVVEVEDSRGMRMRVTGAHSRDLAALCELLFGEG